jgi:hypothetical protein
MIATKELQIKIRERSTLDFFFTRTRDLKWLRIVILQTTPTSDRSIEPQVFMTPDPAGPILCEG